MAVYNWVVDDALDTSGMRGDFDSNKFLRRDAKKRQRYNGAGRTGGPCQAGGRTEAPGPAAGSQAHPAGHSAEEREEEAEERRIARQEASIQRNLKSDLEAKLKEGVERLFASTPVVLNEAMVAMIREARADAPGALSRLDDGTKNEIINTVLGKLVEGQSLTSFTGIASPETVYTRRFQPSKSQNPVWENLLTRNIINSGVKFNHVEFERGIEPKLPRIPPSDALLRRKKSSPTFGKLHCVPDSRRTGCRCCRRCRRPL